MELLREISVSNTTTRPNSFTAFEQVQKAQATRAAIEEELAKPKTYTTESNDYAVEAPKPTLAATGEPVDINKIVDIDPALDDLDDDAELSAKIDGDGTWTDEPSDDDGLWMMAPTDVGLSPLFGRGARLRTFEIIDEQDPHDVLDNESVWGFRLAAA